MRLSRRQLVNAAVLGSVALTIGSLGRSARGANREVNLYTSRHYSTDEKLYELFRQKTGIRVNWVQGNADEILQRLRSEGANSPADIFMTVDAAGCGGLKTKACFNLSSRRRSLKTSQNPCGIRKATGSA
jgi:iron(III) transport system substrate-binding protein